ncbi:MAG: hypothetical protein U1E17_09870 [Geminicoccaceae bacterium]
MSISMRAGLLALALTTAATGTAFAQAGLLSGRTELAPLTLASGKPLAKEPYNLTAGKYYRIAIEADGSAELGVVGAEFFRNVWINEIVINKVEIRPLGVDGIEFDDEGKATISFVPIRPGKFELRVPGTDSDTQRAVFNVK